MTSPYQRRRVVVAAVCVASLAGPSAPAAPQGRPDDTQISTEYRTLPGYREPHTPDGYNRTFYLRYSGRAATRTILVLMPGVFMGAAAFDGLARQLVARTPGVEVWAVDRRSNQLEPRDASRDSLRSRDGSIAYRYLVTAAGAPGGFSPLDRDDVSFLPYWGLDTHLRDLHAVVVQARAQARRVIVGGHSLGATLASLYVAYKLESGKTGQDFVDGLILLDGVVGRTGGGAGAQIAAAVSDLEGGTSDPYNRGVTKYLAEREARNLQALLSPSDLAPRDFVPFPATNLAVAGLHEGSKTSPLELLSSTLGTPTGAVLTNVPRPGGSVLRPAPGVRNVAGLERAAARIEWRVGSVADHPVDLGSYLRSDVQADVNFSEWYFPSRLTLDLTALTVSLDSQTMLIPNREVRTRTLVLGAGRGYLPTRDAVSSYEQVRPTNTIEFAAVSTYSHMDVITANRDNLEVPLLQAWLRR